MNEDRKKEMVSISKEINEYTTAKIDEYTAPPEKVGFMRRAR